MSVNKNDKDKYIVYRRHAGIGDLLLGLYYIWRYAKTTKRQLIVDWRWSTYTNTPTNLFCYLFKDCYISGTAIKGENIEKTEFPAPFYPSYYNNQNINQPPFNGERVYKNRLQREKEAEKLYSFLSFDEQTVIINEEIRTFPEQIILNDDIRNFIIIIWSTLLDSIVTHIKNVYSDILFNKTNIVGIHLKLGNNDPDFNKTFRRRIKGYHGQNIENYIKKQILPIIENLKDSPTIYITTDTEEARIQMEKLVPGCIFYNRIFSVPGCEEYQTPIKRQAQNGLEILRDSLTEMYLLSQCDTVYSTYPHSAFAKMASLLNKRPTINIFK
jgi:hypothetical protein